MLHHRLAARTRNIDQKRSNIVFISDIGVLDLVVFSALPKIPLQLKRTSYSEDPKTCVYIHADGVSLNINQIFAEQCLKHIQSASSLLSLDQQPDSTPIRYFT